ncbi:MAG TPA: TauD/TfdA family dioxygenase, partial [Gemmataceae bacterium]|nr:TauD/TfdA family dioxygenase [Gemmataceae bacterium]
MQHTMLDNSFVSVVNGFNAAQATDNELNDLKELVYRRKVVALKQQLLDRPAYLKFAARFGVLEQFRLKNYHDPEYPNILVINNLNRGQAVGARKLGNMWHSDSSYLPDPLPLTFLHAQRVPAGPGDTLFVDMQPALDELPADLHDLIAGRQA